MILDRKNFSFLMQVIDRGTINQPLAMRKQSFGYFGVSELGIFSQTGSGNQMGDAYMKRIIIVSMR